MAQVAISDAATSERGKVAYIDFKERSWVPGFTFLVDVAAVETALLFGTLARYALFPWWPINFPTSTYVDLAVGVLVIPISFVFVGLCPGYGLGVVERLRRRVTVTVVVFGVLIVWDNIVLHGEWSRGVMLGAFAFALILTLLCESMARKLLIRRDLWGTPIILAGAGKTGAMLARILRDEPQLGFVPVAFVDDSLQKGTEVEGLLVLGPIEEASCLTDHVDTMILTIPGAGSQRLAQLAQGLEFPRIIVVPDLFELPSLWVQPRDFGGILGLELRRNLLIRRKHVIKRLLDYILGVPLFLISLPIVIGAVLCIKIASPGPVFFNQQRDGLHGRKFHMWKLRTMHPNAEARMEELFRQNPAMRQQWQSHAKIENDPRILPVIGTWLRKTSIDELPQLWNVLRGEMSLIGPRPFVDYHLTLFSDDFRQFRSKVRPGITGLWQVLMRNDGDIRAQEMMDTYYVRNWSLWLDLYILLRTIPAVVVRKGAR